MILRSVPLLGLILALGAAVPPADPAAAAGEAAGQSAREPVGESAVTRCLAQPSRLCALSSALQVTAQQDLPISRVDTLLALADTFHRLGQIDRARVTAELARQAAEDIGISIGTEKKLVELAGILAAIGDHEGALATAEAIEDAYLQADAFGAAAVAHAGAGRVEQAGAALARIDKPLLHLKYALQVIEVLAEEQADPGTLAADLQQQLETVDHVLLRALGQARLARLYAAMGEPAAAERLLLLAEESLVRQVGNEAQARLLANLAMADLALGNTEAYSRRANRAAALARLIHSDYDQELAVGEAVQALAAGGLTTEAVALARAVNDLRAQSALMMRLARQDDAAPIVEQLAGQVLATVSEEDSRFERDRARLAVAAALTEVDAVTPAVEVIAAIEDPDAKAQALAVLARPLE